MTILIKLSSIKETYFLKYPNKMKMMQMEIIVSFIQFFVNDIYLKKKWIHKIHSLRMLKIMKSTHSCSITKWKD